MRLLLVDGHYYAYRSFFAIQGLRNSRGEPTNAVFGFVKAVRKMISDLKPDLAAIQAVQKWKFKAGTKGGKPVPVQLEVPIRFNLK